MKIHKNILHLPNVAFLYLLSRKGSVIVNFTITYEMVHHVESLILQDAIDNLGIISQMPVEMKNMSSADGIAIFDFLKFSNFIECTYI